MTAKVDVWMPTYYASLEAATVHLSDGEFRAYWRLICHSWHMAAPLPPDPGTLARIAHKSEAEWRKMQGCIMAFFVLTDSGWINPKVEKELSKAQGHKARAAAGGRAKAAKSGAKKVLKGSEKVCKKSAHHLHTPTGELIENSPRRGRDETRSPHGSGAPLAPVVDRQEGLRLMGDLAAEIQARSGRGAVSRRGPKPAPLLEAQAVTPGQPG